MAGQMALDIILRAIDMATGPVRAVMGQLRALNQLQDAGAAWRDRGQDMQRTGAIMTATAAAMGVGLTKVVAPVMQLEEGINILQTVTTVSQGSMTDALDRTRQAAMEFQRQYGRSASEFVAANTTMASAGLKDVEALAGTAVAAKLAKTALDEMVPTTNLLASLYNTMGNKSADARQEMTRLGDALQATMNLNQIANLSQLGEGLKMAVPAAKASGASLEELLAILGALNTQGLASGPAGSAYAATMNKLIPATRALGVGIAYTASGGVDLINTLRNVEKKYGTFATMTESTKLKIQQAFDVEGARILQLFSGQLDLLEGQMGEISKSTGLVDQTLEVMGQGQAASWRKVVGQLMDLRDTVATTLLPILEALVPPLMSFIEAVGYLAREYPGLLQVAGVFGLFVMGINGTLGPLKTFIGTLQAYRGGFLIGLAGAGKSAVWLGQQLSWVAKVVLPTLAMEFRVLASTLEIFIPGGAAVGKFLRALPGWLGSAMVWLGRASKAVALFSATLLANPIVLIIVGIGALVGAIWWLVENWDDVTDALGRAWSWMEDLWSSIISTMKQAWSDFVDWVIETRNTIVNMSLDVLEWGGVNPLDAIDPRFKHIVEHRLGRTEAAPEAGRQAAPERDDEGILGRLLTEMQRQTAAAVGTQTHVQALARRGNPQVTVELRTPAGTTWQAAEDTEDVDG